MCRRPKTYFEQEVPAPQKARPVSDDINVLALVKGKERYVFLYDDSQRAKTLRTLGRFASNPELSFSWYDAAVLSQKLRNNAPSKEIKVDEIPFK
ncbi:hypothetical protein [Adhaeretor mobilis]|uniref:hypothetical protein n=1 Tax=Adhaeretor mobilis TaxID=1930276 RepID=UPI001FE3BAA8|nr:hypothetical protein [Adhaeretor mobilis]